MTRDETPIIDLDLYRQVPFYPADLPAYEPEVEVVEWHPDDELERYNEHLRAEIDFLRETVADLTAKGNRRFDKFDLALVVTLGVIGTVLAILLFGPN